MKNETKVALSVVDNEPSFNYNYEESTYGKDSVVSYGPDNEAPTLFRNCYRNSATLKAIIDSAVNYVCGEKIEIDDAGWSVKVNRSGMTIREFIANLALDYNVYGGYAFQVIYSKLDTVAELYPLDFSKCRTNATGTKIFYSKKSWTKYSTKSEEFDKYDPEHISKKKTQIFYFKGAFTKTVYPLPPYFGAITDVMTEIQCSKYAYNSIANGFAARHLIQFPEDVNLTDQQKEAIEDAIKNKFCGPDSTTPFMLYWKQTEKPLEITKIESDNDPQRYLDIKSNCRENIFVSMHCTPLLIGLPNASNGFSTDEYKDSFKLYNKTVIEPMQRNIITSIEKVLGAHLTITPFTIDFER